MGSRASGVRDDLYLIVLVTPSVVLPHPKDKVEDGDERSDRVRISSQHNVAEADVVVGCNMACSYARERCLGDLLGSE